VFGLFKREEEKKLASDRFIRKIRVNSATKEEEKQNRSFGFPLILSRDKLGL
jgi:hypothetical protein